MSDTTSSCYLTTTEVIHNQDTRGFRGKKRSLSLNNIADDVDVAIHHQEEKPHFLNLSSGGNRLKGLKKKLNIKLSKSNTDLAAHNVTARHSKDSSKLDLSYFRNNIDIRGSPREIRKQFAKDQLKRKNKPAEHVTETGLSDHSHTSNSKLNLLDKTYIINSDVLDLSDHSVVGELGVNEYYDDLGGTYDIPDENDGSVLPVQQIEKLWRKIEKIREDLVHLQALRDDNVSEYLKTTDNHSTDYINNAKVKVNFERNNQKTNISIQILQKKLEKYLQQVKEIEENGGVHGTKRIMKVVQDSMRSGASSISGAVSKPLESFNNFIKKEKKISSTENVYITVTDDDETEGYRSMLAISDDENLSNSAYNLRAEVKRMMTSENTDEVDALKSRVEELEKENEDSKQSINQFKEKLNWVTQSLQEESYKTEQLQFRLNDLFNQWNDLTELHQNEMMGMKDEMDRTMERIECVEYRFTERTADLDENLENCVTKISKIEKQQHEQQQPIDNLLDMDAKILLSKFLSFVINICVVSIFVVSSITRMVMPFVANRARFLASGVALTAIIFLWRNIDYECFNIFTNLFYPLNNEVVNT